MKKAISPLISWILIVGMVITVGSMVSVYLINQAREQAGTFESSQYQNLYCPEVALDAQQLCYETLTEISGDNYAKIKLKLKNRGAYSLHDIKLIVKSDTLKTLTEEEYGLFDINDDSESFPISPGSLAYLKFNVKVDKDEEQYVNGNYYLPSGHGIKEISITPTINIEDNNIICNQKVFILKNLENSNIDHC